MFNFCPEQLFPYVVADMTSSRVTLTVSLLLGRRNDLVEVGQFSIVAATRKKICKFSLFHLHKSFEFHCICIKYFVFNLNISF